MEPSPPTRSSGDFNERSLLRATPFCSWKLTDISVKSVFWVLSEAWFWVPVLALNMLRASRSFSPRLMPLSAPSFRATEALPPSERFIASTVAPPVLTARFRLPLPSSMSWLASAFSSGSMEMPVRSAFSVTLLAAGDEPVVTVEEAASLPW